MHISLLGLVAFLTILAWLVLGYILFQMWRDRRKPKPNPIIGHVTSMVEDATGVAVNFKFDEAEVGSDGIRTIKNATIHSVSLVGPDQSLCGGRIESIDGKPV